MIDQQRADEAGPLLEHAPATLMQLRATPALTRAQALTPVATNPVAS
jgi:hypothetical protein